MQNKIVEYLKTNNITIKHILEEIFNKKIYDIEFSGIEELNKIPEYQFKLVKINVLLENKRKYNVFLKFISKYKMNETIFCYWYFCEEKYKENKCKQKKYYNKKANIIEYKNTYCGKMVDIQLLNREKKIWKNSETHFIELEKYIQNKCKRKQTTSKSINKSEEILFIGII